MPRGKEKKGLRVKFCENVLRLKTGRVRQDSIAEAEGEGWFIQVWRGSKYYSLMNLRFVRERDAVKAVVALTVAGLDTASAMARAGAMRVKQIACEALEW